VCFLVLAHGNHPAFPLVLAANRDEFFARAAQPAHFWSSHPDLLAGRDGQEGGTWMGITRAGRFAALTNFRDPANQLPAAPSRGRLVLDFLTGSGDRKAHLDYLRREGARFNPFNLLFGRVGELYWYSNRAPGDACPLSTGTHALSNHLLDTPWPKVEVGRRKMGSCLRKSPPTAGEEQRLCERLFLLLEDRRQFPPGDLPDTGVGPAAEQLLSPIFISMPGYGTRCSTVLLVDRDGRVTFRERTFDHEGEPRGEVSHKFRIQAET